ncbi:MAG: hypothetical protein P8Q87_05010, partial [Candidatus Poseidonia sp.]|nr:hypothetical protein [Poseidonia sp.]
RMNESYGLTTLKSMHVKHIRGEEAEGKHDVVFTFTGKSNKEWEIKVEDDRLVDLILRTNRLGAKDADLFMYISAAGNEVDLKAEHINQYIRASSGEGFTAKNFRTWAATSRCAARLAFLSKTQTPQAMKKWLKALPNVESISNIWSQGEWNAPQSEAQRTKVMLAVIDTVASDLGNTRAVCRSSYIHPWFMDAWMEGTLGDAWGSVDSERKIQDLSQEESATLRLLKTI